MASLFSNYIKNIAVCIIFGAFISMIIPSGSFKKYIEIVLGFITIIIILNPIRGLVFKDNSSFELEVFKKASQLENNSILNNKDIYENSQRQLILSSYKQKIEQQISTLITQNMNLNVESISIEINEDFDSQEFAQINKIELSAIETKTKNTDNETEKIHIDNVEKITIKNDSADVYTENEAKRNYEMEKKLQSLISDFYKLSNDNIYIIVHI